MVVSTLLRRAVYIRHVTSLASTNALPLLDDALSRAWLTACRGARGLSGEAPLVHPNTEEGPAPDLHSGVKYASMAGATASHGEGVDVAETTIEGGGNSIVAPQILLEHQERMKNLRERRQKRPLGNEEVGMACRYATERCFF